MKKLLSLTAVSFLVAAFTFVGTVWAQGVDDKIKSLEGEIAKLKTQQIEMKKEATAAADGLPTFGYRPGRGMTITAANKSWAFNISYRVNVHMYNHLDGRSHFIGFNEEGELDEIGVGTTSGELYPRRNRLYLNLCWDDCFITMEQSFDGERSSRIAQARDSEIMWHLEQWNPYLPSFSIGLRRGAGRTALTRSSSSDARLEHAMLWDFGGWGATGSHAGAGLGWDGVDIGSGEYDLFINWASSSQGSHFAHLDSDRKGFLGYIGGKPFSKTKSKWLEGFETGVGLQFHAIDKFDGRDFEITTNERRGEQLLFSLAEDIGSGFSYIVVPGVRWRIGPYMFRGNYLRTQTEGRRDAHRGVQGKGFEINHQLFVWSPKGLLTGSSSTAGSLLIGWAFERTDVECGVIDCNAQADGTKRLTVLNRELGIWYFIRPAMRVGTWWNWYQTSNTHANTQVAVGCKKNITAATAGKGDSRECDWHTLNLGLQYQW